LVPGDAGVSGIKETKKMSRKKLSNKRIDVQDVQVVGAAVYRVDQWDRLVELSVDPEKLSDSFHSWKESFEKTTTQLKQQGLNVINVQVDVEELNEWCQKKKIELNGAARSQYAAELAREMDKPPSR
jgi:predicted ATP-grasp superfamily ATP-dependent carboligase